jgi:hypothetical protein
MCFDHFNETIPNYWECFFCKSQCSTNDSNLVINNFTKRLVENFEESEKLPILLQSELNTTQKYKAETLEFLKKCFGEAKKNALVSKKKEIEDIEKKYDNFFSQVKSLQTQIELSINLENTEKFSDSNKKLRDAIENKEYLLDKNGWSSTVNETKNIIAELNNSKETLKSYHKQIEDFSSNIFGINNNLKTNLEAPVVDLNNNNLLSDLEDKDVDLNNNNLKQNLNDDSFKPNLEGRASQLLNIFDDIDFSNQNGHCGDLDDKKSESLSSEETDAFLKCHSSVCIVLLLKI